MLRNLVDLTYSLHSQFVFSGDEIIEDFNQALNMEANRLNGQNIPEQTTLTNKLFYRTNIFSLKENQQHEIRSTINHLVENTKSYQLIKSVLGKNSKAAYQGRIYVDSKAQKTDGYQLSKGILLSDEASFFSKPELKIYADDVKCSHGSSSGNIDQDSLHYLMTRGLNHKDSTNLLIKGFLNDVIDLIASCPPHATLISAELDNNF